MYVCMYVCMDQSWALHHPVMMAPYSVHRSWSVPKINPVILFIVSQVIYLYIELSLASLYITKTASQYYHIPVIHIFFFFSPFFSSDGKHKLKWQ